MKRFKVTYRWGGGKAGGPMVCDYVIRDRGLKVATVNAKNFCECQERVRGIKCDLISVDFL